MLNCKFLTNRWLFQLHGFWQFSNSDQKQNEVAIMKHFVTCTHAYWHPFSLAHWLNVPMLIGTLTDCALAYWHPCSLRGKIQRFQSTEILLISISIVSHIIHGETRNSYPAFCFAKPLITGIYFHLQNNFVWVEYSCHT